METQMGFNFFMGYLSTNAKVVSRRWKHELKEVLLFPSRNTILHFTYKRCFGHDFRVDHVWT